MAHEGQWQPKTTDTLLLCAGLVVFQAGSPGIIAWQGGQAYQNITIQAQLTNAGAALGNPTGTSAWLDTAIGLPSPVLGIPNSGQFVWNVPTNVSSGWYSFRVQSLGTMRKFNVSQPVLVQGVVQLAVTLLGSVTDVQAFQAGSSHTAWTPAALELNIGLTGWA